VFESRSRLKRLDRLAICVFVMLAGCGGEEAKAPSVEQVESPTTRIEESPAAEATSPIEPEPSPDELAAREAFRAMTAEGVSLEEVDSATQRIQELGPAALPVLVAGLKSEEFIQREMAATMLVLIGADAHEVSDALVEALNDESDSVRANVATALAQMEGQATHVIPVFGEILESEDATLQKMAVMNLDMLDPAAAKPLVGQLITTLDSDDPMILRLVVTFLGKIGPDATPALDKIKALDTADDAELETAVTVAVMQIETDAE